MMDLSELIRRRDALERARYGGRRTVEVGDRSITYKSDAEMKAALLDLNRKIAAASGPVGAPFVTFATSKGL